MPWPFNSFACEDHPDETPQSPPPAILRKSRRKNLRQLATDRRTRSARQQPPSRTTSLMHDCQTRVSSDTEPDVRPDPVRPPGQSLRLSWGPRRPAASRSRASRAGSAAADRPRPRTSRACPATARTSTLASASGFLALLLVADRSGIGQHVLVDPVVQPDAALRRPP